MKSLEIRPVNKKSDKKNATLLRYLYREPIPKVLELLYLSKAI